MNSIGPMNFFRTTDTTDTTDTTVWKPGLRGREFHEAQGLPVLKWTLITELSVEGLE